MESRRQYSRIDTAELKGQLFKKLGKQRADMYFYHLKRLLSFKISKLEFEKLCRSLIGKENVGLHNMFIRSILRNACIPCGVPGKNASTRQLLTAKTSDTCNSLNGKDLQLDNCRSLHGMSGKGPFGKAGNSIITSSLQRLKDQQSLPELISIGSKAPLDVASVEDGEEVEQARGSPSVQSRSPLVPPLGILQTARCFPRKAFGSSSKPGFPLFKSGVPETFLSNSELPDSRSLKKQLEQKLESKGLNVTVNCANLLNHGLDAFLRRLIKPCLDLAKARSNPMRMNQLSRNTFPFSSNFPWKMDDIQIPNQPYNASLLDFQVSMDLNPPLLGNDWASNLEKISSYTMEK